MQILDQFSTMLFLSYCRDFIGIGYCTSNLEWSLSIINSTGVTIGELVALSLYDV